MLINAMVLCWEKFQDTQKCLLAVREEIKSLINMGHKTKLVIVDNGSNLEMQGWINDFVYEEELTLRRVEFVRNAVNMGISIARNQALQLVDNKVDYVILLDGDISVVKGSFNAMVKYVDEFNRTNSIKCGCLGAASYQYVTKPEEATPEILEIRKVDEGQQLGGVSGKSIAWTQFGIFAGELFTGHNIKFVDEGVFGLPGYGYEDDLFALSILKRGYRILRFTDIWYFHNLSTDMSHDGHLSIGERRISERKALAQKIISEKRVP